MGLEQGSDSLVEFKRCVRNGFSIRKIRSTLEDLGHSLERFSDVDLIKLWRKCSSELAVSMED